MIQMGMSDIVNNLRSRRATIKWHAHNHSRDVLPHRIHIFTSIRKGGLHGDCHWTVTHSGCPSANSATWVLDDFCDASLVYDPAFTVTHFDTATMLDRLGNGAY